MLGQDGEELRSLVTKEAIRVTEAVTLGSVIDVYNSIPGPLKTLVSSGTANGSSMMSDAEWESMMELRQQVFRIWGLLQSSDNFDPTILQPILQVKQQLIGLSLKMPFEETILRLQRELIGNCYFVEKKVLHFPTR